MFKFATFPQPMFLWDEDEVKLVVDEYLYLSHKASESNRMLVMGFDLETTGLNINDDLPLTYSIYVDIPIHIPELGMETPGLVRFAGHSSHLHLLQPLLDHPNIMKVGSRISAYDWFISRNVGVRVEDPIHDTLNMDWLANENRTGRHGLKETFLDYYGFRMTSFRSVTGSLDVRTWPFEKMLDYGSMDAYASVKVHQVLVQRLREMPMKNGMNGYQFYTKVLRPYQAVLREMTCNGIAVDQEGMEALEGPLREELEKIQSWFNKQWVKLQIKTEKHFARKSGSKAQKAAALTTLNLNSTAQLRHLFLEILERPVLKKNVSKSSGNVNASLDESVLSEYADEGCDYSNKILEYRKIEKLVGTYIRGKSGDGGILPKLKHGRVHAGFYLGTVTGRLASSEPNMQNIPAKGKIAKGLRRCFIAPEGYKLICGDYKQLEMLLFAHFSKDPVMLAAARGGQDFHCMTGASMYGKTYEEMLIAKLKDDGDADRLLSFGVKTLELTELEQEMLVLRSSTKAINFG